MTSPFVVIHQYAADALAAFVHLDQKVRSVFGTNPQDLERRLVNTHIAEFGFDQPTAQAAAKNAVAPLLNPPAAPVDLTPKVSDLDRQLTTMLQRALKAEADSRLLKPTQDDLAAAKAEIGELKAQLTNAAQSRLPSQDTPPATGGSVSTPVGETLPAETSPPQTNTGAAPNSAATGGERGLGTTTSSAP